MQFLRHMKIAHKLTLSFSMLIAVVLLMAIVLFTSINDIKTAEEVGNNARQLGYTYQLYQRSFADERQGLLYYLLTGDRAGLQKYNKVAPQTGQYFETLSNLSNNNPDLSALVKNLAANHAEWTKKFAAEQIKLMRNYLTVNQARAIEVTGAPQAVIANFEKTAAAFAKKLDQIIEQAIQLQTSAIDRFVMTIVVSIGLIVVVSLFLGFTLTRVIAGPIGRITNMMGLLASGDLEIDIRGSDRKDEIGGMAKAVEVFKKNAIEQKQLQSQEAAKQEQERLRHERMESLAQDFDKKMESGLSKVANSVGDVMESATTMARNAAETEQLSRDASSSIEEASANIQTVSSASTELSSSISEISRQMSQASEVSRAAVDEIERTNSRVVALNEAADSIGQVVQIISDIAEQTNLLALNATIESARAGEAGKGFAVVAHEVKSLANQTANATEEISQKISEIQTETGAAAEAVMGIGETIRKIDELTAVVASAVEEQGAATEEIARNVEEASQGTESVAGVVQSVARAADDTGRLAEGQKSVVEELEKNNSVLKDDISTFLNAVKSL